MRHLIHPKQTPKTKSRAGRTRKSAVKTLRETPREQVAVIAGNVVPSALDTEAIVEAAAAEEPLPLVMAQMALWGTAMSALMIPIGLFTLVASPFAVARDIFRSRTQEPVAVAG